MDTIIFFISVFLAGILSFFSPCILPLLPVYAGVLLDDKDGAQASSGKFSISVVSLLRTLAFIDKEGKLVKTQPGFMDKGMVLKTLKEMG